MMRDGARRARRALSLVVALVAAYGGPAAAGTPSVPVRDFAGELLGLPAPTLQAPSRLTDAAPMPAAPSLPKDPAHALAWHAFAARGGSANSQHDLGWLLMSQRGPSNLDAATAKAAGIFWLQRAAEQQHGFAIRKLQEAGITIERPAAR